MDLRTTDRNAARYIQYYRCGCFQPYNFCSCSHKVVGSAAFLRNVKKLAQAISMVMALCNVQCDKRSALIDVITFYFLNYEEIRHRIDTVPHKRLHRLDVIHDLTCKCSLNRVDAQVAFSIIKRAFKAFYYGTDEGGVPNPLLNNQLKHSQQCLWHYAAYRTAQVYAAYENMFAICQKRLQFKICIMYERTRKNFEVIFPNNENFECICMKCFKQIAADNLKPVESKYHLHNSLDVYGDPHSNMMSTAKKYDAPDQKESITPTCSCRILNLEEDKEINSHFDTVNTGFSQGPFECHWYNITKEEAEADDAVFDFKLPDEFKCEPDICKNDSDSCDSICECICESCECECESHSESGVEISKESLEEKTEKVDNYQYVFDLNKRVLSKESDKCHAPNDALRPPRLQLAELRGQKMNLKTSKRHPKVFVGKKSYVSSPPAQAVTKSVQPKPHPAPSENDSLTETHSSNINTSGRSQNELPEDIVKFKLSALIGQRCRSYPVLKIKTIPKPTQKA
uniref:Uncharacterized protein n=1 Tax=Glossina palpalis gambiensis TaxID=67801 RepID=A0A1B0BJ38_9MUSC